MFHCKKPMKEKKTEAYTIRYCGQCEHVEVVCKCGHTALNGLPINQVFFCAYCKITFTVGNAALATQREQ